MTNSSPNKPLRFTVRKLLIVVAGCAVILACYARLTSGHRQSRIAEKQIRAAGGTILWSTGSTFYDAMFPSIVQVDLQNCKLTNKEYAALARIPDYFMLIIDSDIFDQQAMRKLSDVKHLSGLSLEPDSVAESAVRAFQKQRPDVVVMVGLNGDSPYREYPRPSK